MAGAGRAGGGERGRSSGARANTAIRRRRCEPSDARSQVRRGRGSQSTGPRRAPGPRDGQCPHPGTASKGHLAPPPPPSSVLATVNRANPQELWSCGGARVTTTAVAASSHLRTSSPAPDLGRSDPHRPPQSTPGAWSGWLRTSREGRGRRTGRLFWFTDSLCLAVPRFPWDNRM